MDKEELGNKYVAKISLENVLKNIQGLLKESEENRIKQSKQLEKAVESEVRRLLGL